MGRRGGRLHLPQLRHGGERHSPIRYNRPTFAYRDSSSARRRLAGASATPPEDLRLDHGPSRSSGTSQRPHPPRGICRVPEPRHAVVDRQGQHGAALAGAEGILWPRAVPADSHRHVVQDPRDDRVPRPPGRRMGAEPDLRPERGGAGGETHISRRRRGPHHLLRAPEDRGAETHAER